MNTAFFHEENRMKFLTSLTLFIILPVTVACADSSTETITHKMLKPLIEQQCASELKASKIWQVSAFLWTATQQQHAQQKICGCVSENALNDVPAKQLVMATFNEAAKNKLIQQAVMNSLKGCAKEALK